VLGPELVVLGPELVVLGPGSVEPGDWVSPPPGETKA
jgi:hypothetical protein